MTDHNTSEAVDYMVERGLMRADGLPVDGFLIIPGQEVTTDEGHLLCLGREAAEQFEGQTRAGSLPAHPRSGRAGGAAPSLRYFSRGHSRAVLDTLPIDALEVFNAATTLHRYNKKAFKYAQERGLPMTSSSDAHHEAAIGAAYTILDTADFTVKGVLRQIVQANQLNQTYLKTKDKFRKTWNNWLRLRKKRPKGTPLPAKSS